MSLICSPPREPRWPPLPRRRSSERWWHWFVTGWGRWWSRPTVVTSRASCPSGTSSDPVSEVRMDLMSEPVSTIMSTSVRTCRPDDNVETLMQLMTERRIRHVPVVVDDVLVGIVSIGDVVKSRMGELQKDRDELLEYISAR